MNKKGDKNDRKARYVALSATFLFAVLVLGVLLFCGLYRPFPPPPEYGVEVNLGYSEVGTGDRQAMDPLAAPPASVQESYRAEDESVLTAEDDQAPALPKISDRTPRKKPENRQEKTEKAEEKSTEPELNPLALYPGKRKGSENSSQGETSQAGDQGKPEGDANAKGYAGNGGSGGISFSLNGRTLMSLVKPVYNSEEVGTVVVRIWVNRAGQVTRVVPGVKGTTTMDRNLWKTAEAAALQSRFVPKENAPEEQVGTISYRFVRGS